MEKSSRVSVDHDKGVQEAQEVRSGRSSSLPTCLSWAAGIRLLGTAQGGWHGLGWLARPRLVGTAQAGWLLLS